MSQEKPATGKFLSALRTKTAWVLPPILLLAVCAAFWYGTKSKHWSDDREPRGAICSVAAGTLPDGREIVVVGGILQNPDRGSGNRVCCYDAGSGKILWEHQEGNTHSNDLENFQVSVAMDSQGDVLTVSCLTDQQMARLEKRSGASGRLLWSMDFRYPVNFHRDSDWQYHNHFFPPSVDRDGNVWLLSSDRLGNTDKIHLTVVNGLTGGLTSKALVAENHTQDVRIMDLICLDGGGAVLFHMQQKERHVSQYSADGKRIGGFPLKNPFKGYDRKVSRFFVDEWNQRLFVCDEIGIGGWSASDWAERNVQTAAYSIATGKELWNESMVLEGRWGTPRGRIPELIRLRPDGDLELRHETTENINSINWQTWTNYKGFPVPTRKMEKKTRLLRTIMSGVNGSHRAPDVMKSPENWFYQQGTESGSTIKEVFNLGNRLHAGSVFRCRDSRRWLPGADKTGTKRMHCFRMIRCPSGRLVLTRDPKDFRYGQMENLWQVQSAE